MKINLKNLKNKKIITIAAVAAVLVIVVVAVIISRKNQKDKGGGPEVPVFAVNTTLAVEGQIRDYIAFNGDIIAGSTVDVYSEAAGKVSEIYVSVGRRVNRGDQIAAVDPSRPGMTYRHSIATAPIGGTIIAIPAQIGMTVSQAVPLARISGGGGLEIQLHIAERFISRMAMNLSCEITTDAWPGETFLGSISEVSPTIDPVSRTMEIRINVSNADSKLKPGMFAKARVITERKNNIVKIPVAAMINRFGEQYVYVIEEVHTETITPEEQMVGEKKGFFASIKGFFGSLFRKKEKANEEAETAAPVKQYVVRKRIIRPGILIDGVLEIQGGLSPNEEIVVRGQTLLDDGARVNIIERTAPLGENQ